MLNVTARAPTRVDLGGGTLDIYPLSQILERKVTVNFAVNLFAEVSITLLEGNTYTLESYDQKVLLKGDYTQVCAAEALPLVSAMIRAFWSHNYPAFNLTTKAKSPAGAGLGGSSALAVALLGALMELKFRLAIEHDRLDDRNFIQCVQDVETSVIKTPTGCQDYWGALRGGISAITFPPGGAVLTHLPAIHSDVLSNDLVLCFSGKSRNSGINNWAIFKRAFDGDQRLIADLNSIGDLALQMVTSISTGDWANAWLYSKQEWDLRKQLWPEMATSQTDHLEKTGYANGAVLSRVCGAGGGGVMMFIAKPESKQRLSAALQNAGGTILNGNYIDHGLKITVR